jgi:hypothetical protein
MVETTVSSAPHAGGPPATGQRPHPMPARFSIVCYENEVPEFVRKEMERLYENIFSSVALHRIYDADKRRLNTYVVWENEEVMTIFLFYRERQKVTVFNQMIHIGHAEIDRFAHYIFNRFARVAIITFKAIETGRKAFTFPFQQFRCTEDIVLTLPRSEGEYLASLGKSTRKTIRGYTNRLMRNYPSFRYDVYEKEEVNEQHIRDIIRFNRERMASKSKHSAIDEGEAERIIKLVREYGLVGVASIDGTVCAGAISCQVGSHYYMLVSSHDPGYDAQRLGLLCCYLCICDCIGRGGGKCHFLWGRYENKYMLGGVQRDLECVVLYRSHGRLLLNAGTALKNAFTACLFQAKIWLLYDAKNRKSFFFRVAGSVLQLTRSLHRRPERSGAADRE